jgi:hypothetical protein
MADYADLERFRTLVEPREFVFAKTMPEIPHWYTMRRSWAADGSFDEAVALQRRIGYVRSWPPGAARGRKYTYLNLNGFKYWTMGEPVAACPLMNRAAVSYPGNPFDSVAAVYDDRFADPEHRREDDELMGLLDIMSGERVLDIGSGTGVLLDRHQIDPDLYVGCEPSSGMRAVFTAKHPGHTVIPAPLEDCAAGQFDLIVALYGTASYLSPEALATLNDRLALDGRMFLMFYEDGYEPVSCVGVEPSNHYEGTRHLMPGAATPWHSYWIVQ